MTHKLSSFSRAIFLALTVVVVLVPSSALAFTTSTIKTVPQQGTTRQLLPLTRLRNKDSWKDASPTALAYTVSPEPIHTAFNVATFGPQVRTVQSVLKNSLQQAQWKFLLGASSHLLYLPIRRFSGCSWLSCPIRSSPRRWWGDLVCSIRTIHIVFAHSCDAALFEKNL